MFAKEVLGSRVADDLQKRINAGFLMIGSDSFSREDLANRSCYCFTAAANLSRLLDTIRVPGTTRKIHDTRDLYQNVPPEALIVPRLGSYSLAVLGAAFEKKGLGGANPLVSWIQKHHEKDAPITTFLSMKKREERHSGEKEERRILKRRKQRRKDTAHELRVNRHITRTNGGTVTS